MMVFAVSSLKFPFASRSKFRHERVSVSFELI